MQADQYEVTVEASQTLEPGEYGVHIEIRDSKTDGIKRKTKTKTLNLKDDE